MKSDLGKKRKKTQKKEVTNMGHYDDQYEEIVAQRIIDSEIMLKERADMKRISDDVKYESMKAKDMTIDMKSLKACISENNSYCETESSSNFLYRVCKCLCDKIEHLEDKILSLEEKGGCKKSS